MDADITPLFCADMSHGFMGLSDGSPLPTPFSSAAGTKRFVNGGGNVCPYLHGDVEGAAGFDIPGWLRGIIDLSQGEQPCRVMLGDGKTVECTLVMWIPHGNAHSDQPRRKGLIVGDADARSLAYARAKCAERSFYL